MSAVKIRRSVPVRQRGAVMVLAVAAMLGLLAMVALALDVSHLTLNKARLQNTVDAAALSAAKALDQTGSTIIATTVALQAFQNNANTTGNRELSAAYANGGGQINVTVQYSATLPPFTPGAPKGPYVRVSATGWTWASWLASLVGVANLDTSATAVAGPSPTVNNACDLVPMMVCGDSAAGSANNWGYSLNTPVVLKSSAPGSAAVGPGNFQLIQLGGTGANLVRQNLAGGYQACSNIGDVINTETGNEAGPVSQGLNTRFDIYQGGGMNEATYPPDVITRQTVPALTVDANGNIWQGTQQLTGPGAPANSYTLMSYNYQTYVSQLTNSANYNFQPISSGGVAAFNRRILSVPVGNCTGTSNGSTTVPVLGFMCFFLLQQVNQQGNNDYVFGQFIGNCDVNGVPGPNPGSGPGPYIIQLYHDPSSGDS